MTTTDARCINCGEPIRYQDGSAKYRHVRNDRFGPAGCSGRDTVARAALEQHVDDVLVALDGGQLHLEVGP